MAWNGTQCCVAISMAVLLFTAGCMQQERTLRIATTTSLYDTGLLDRLEDAYEAETGVDLLITSQGSGRAIELARRGDVDLLLIHSPREEEALMQSGDGIVHRCFAYNHYLLLGPAEDPAGIRGLAAPGAFARIKQLGEAGKPGILFLSRGDNSGTHRAEMGLWTQAGFDYAREVQGAGTWYIEAGRGMGESLLLANEKGAYVLSDAGTYLAFRGDLGLSPLVTADPQLLNRYSATVVDPAKHPAMDGKEGMRFVNWVLSGRGREILAEYGTREYGVPLFTPLTEDLCREAPFSCNCSPIPLSSTP